MDSLSASRHALRLGCALALLAGASYCVAQNASQSVRPAPQPAAPAIAARQPAGAASGPYTALQIAQSFIGADGNRDGELTRGEAQRLRLMPYSFEEMDLNHDGILTRFEYEDGVR